MYGWKSAGCRTKQQEILAGCGRSIELRSPADAMFQRLKQGAVAMVRPDPGGMRPRMGAVLRQIFSGLCGRCSGHSRALIGRCWFLQRGCARSRPCWWPGVAAAASWREVRLKKADKALKEGLPGRR